MKVNFFFWEIFNQKTLGSQISFKIFWRLFSQWRRTRLLKSLSVLGPLLRSSRPRTEVTPLHLRRLRVVRSRLYKTGVCVSPVCWTTKPLKNPGRVLSPLVLTDLNEVNMTRHGDLRNEFSRKTSGLRSFTKMKPKWYSLFGFQTFHNPVLKRSNDY